MANVDIHNVERIQIVKRKLDSGTFVCSFLIKTINSFTKQENHEEITFYSENEENFEIFEESEIFKEIGE